MKRPKAWALTLVVVLLATLAATPVMAHRRHHYHPAWGWGWWPYPYAAPYAVPYAVPLFVPPVVSVPAPVVIQQHPQTYIQRQEEPQQYWYLCENVGYHPYVQECSTGWLRVLPTPPTPTR